MPEQTPGTVTALDAASRRAPGRHLAIVGPTASGKSAVAMALCRARIAAGEALEIVSCDSMQVYRGMDVGTAKATVAERREVPHHLLDVVDPTEEYNVARFVADVDAVLDDIEGRGASAVLVGGTGLYLRAVVDGFEPPPHHPGIVAELEAEPDTALLTERLEEVDPDALSRIPPGNRRRIVRALEVFLGSGRPFSSYGAEMTGYRATPFVLSGLRPEREDLDGRIAARYDAQMAAGMLQEVQALGRLGPELSRTAAQALGYRELLAHVRGECTLDQALERARASTRRFAVRQLRWFNRDPRIAWFASPDTPAPRVGDGARDSGGDDVGSVAAAVDALWRKRAVARAHSVATVE